MATLHSCAGAFPTKKGGIQVLAGQAPYSQIVGSLLRTPWPAQLAGKMNHKIPVIFLLKMNVLFASSLLNFHKNVSSTNMFQWKNSQKKLFI
jgi:hypothetical protein